MCLPRVDGGHAPPQLTWLSVQEREGADGVSVEVDYQLLSSVGPTLPPEWEKGTALLAGRR